jgi:hypothetical protein
MISTNIINNDQSGSHKPFKGGGSLPYLGAVLKVVDHSLTLSSSCGSLRSLLVIFLDIVGFVFLWFFLRYRWCCHWSFSVLSKSFFYLFFFSSLIPFYCNSWKEEREREILEAQRNFNDNTISIVRKILTKRIQHTKKDH